MLILGIESSCDETAVALVRDGHEVVHSLVASQIALHAPYGGVVPEVACRAHAETLIPLLRQLEAESRIPFTAIDAVAATSQPGLIGALLIGLTAGKTLAWALDKPFIAVDHIDGHIHAPRMDPLSRGHPIPFPHVSLVVSGGHTEAYLCPSGTEKQRITATADDAAGECFDKVAALLGLGYPGGPAIERAALPGNPRAVSFPRGAPGSDGLAVSFSGLKTAVLQHLQKGGYSTKAGRPRLARTSPAGHIARTGSAARSEPPAPPAPLTGPALADIAASFQQAALDMLVRVGLAVAEHAQTDHLTLTGGVAANTALRDALSRAGQARGISVHLCPKNLCGDNAAMIAAAAHPFATSGLYSPLTAEAVPN
jgi:N6-L-threonylcarbamoyladenine synthase